MQPAHRLVYLRRAFVDQELIQSVSADRVTATRAALDAAHSVAPDAVPDKDTRDDIEDESVRYDTRPAPPEQLPAWAR